MSPLQFHLLLMAYCSRFEASVTSYYRTATHNAALPRSVVHSAHLFWMAADVVYDTSPWPDLGAVQDTARRLGLMVVREGDHDHLQPLGWPAG